MQDCLPAHFLPLGSYFSFDMNRILYTSPYVPPEWIAAHGLGPCRVMPADPAGRLPAWDRQGLCPYVRAFSAEVMAADEAGGIVMTTVCDQMRRAFDGVAQGGRVPAFLMDVPSTWQSSTARRLYLEELERLSRFLSSLGGSRPSNTQLAETMRTYDDRRARLRDLQAEWSPQQWGHAAAEFGRTGQIPSAEETGGRQTWSSSKTKPGVPLALIGGPLRQEDLTLYDEIEACGGTVALDLTESGLRGLCRRFDRRSLAGQDVLLELADAYLDGIWDVSQRPNHRFYEGLGRTLKARPVAGLVVHRFVWCDLWHAEIEPLRQRTGLPVLDLDEDGHQAASRPRRATRIAAFVEMLQ
jgi:benzoyl-CoA reductase/2-hydroxyglutaryl-CoA dehydratase subunit BcrC/BadD/HgdB